MNVRGQGQGGRILLFGHGHRDGVLAVVAGDTAGIVLTQIDVRHIAEIDRILSGYRQGDVLKALQGVELLVRGNGQLLVTHIGIACGVSQVGAADIRGNGIHAHAVLVHLLREQLHANILLAAAVDGYLGHGVQLLQLRHNVVVYIVIEVIGVVLADRQDHIGHQVGVQFQHDGVFHLVRHADLRQIHLLFQIIVSLIHIRAVLVFQHGDGHVLTGHGGNGVQTA